MSGALGSVRALPSRGGAGEREAGLQIAVCEIERAREGDIRSVGIDDDGNDPDPPIQDGEGGRSRRNRQMPRIEGTPEIG
jgi:hypothetical protein